MFLCYHVIGLYVVLNTVTSGLPVDKESSLFDTVYNLVEPHIYCLGTLLLAGVVRNSGNILVVCLYGHVRLVKTKLIQCGANGDYMKEYPKF